MDAGLGWGGCSSKASLISFCDLQEAEDASSLARGDQCPYDPKLHSMQCKSQCLV